MKGAKATTGIILFIAIVFAGLFHFSNVNETKTALTNATDIAVQSAMLEAVEETSFIVSSEISMNEDDFYRLLVENLNIELANENDLKIEVLNISLSPPLVRIRATLDYIGEDIVYTNTYVIEQLTEDEITVILGEDD